MGFKPKDNTGSRIMQQQEVVFSQEQIVEDVFNDDYILVVGRTTIVFLHLYYCILMLLLSFARFCFSSMV